jgi:hypothetical protein
VTTPRQGWRVALRSLFRTYENGPAFISNSFALVSSTLSRGSQRRYRSVDH